MRQGRLAGRPGSGSLPAVALLLAVSVRFGDVAGTGTGSMRASVAVSTGGDFSSDAGRADLTRSGAADGRGASAGAGCVASAPASGEGARRGGGGSALLGGGGAGAGAEAIV